MKSVLFLLLRYSEKSTTKCIGITIETRPDYCLRKHIRSVLCYTWQDDRNADGSRDGNAVACATVFPSNFNEIA